MGLAGGADGDDRSAASAAAIYTAAVYGAQVVLFAAGLVQKGLLGPTRSGYWSLMTTIYSFFGLASLGVFHGAIRQIPFHRGAGDLRGAGDAADTAATVHVAAMAVLGLLVAAVSLVFGGGWAPALRWSLVLLGLTAPARAWQDVLDLLLQVTRRFSLLSRTLVVRAGTTLVGQTLLVWALGLYGMFAGLVLVAAASFVYWRRAGLMTRAAPPFRWRVERPRVLELLRVGVPVMVYSQIWLLFSSVDNLVVVRGVGVTQLGYYALAVSVTTYVMLLPNSIATASFPRLQERFARAELAELKGTVLGIQTLLGLALLPAFVALSFFGVPILIRHGLPSFEPAVGVVRIMLAGSFCLALAQMPIEYAITTNRRWQTTWLLAVSLVVNTVANLVAVAALHRGIHGAAVATAASYAFVFVAATTYALARHVPRARLARHVVGLGLVVVYTDAVLWAVQIVGGDGRGVWTDIALGAAKAGVALMLLAPLFVLAVRALGAGQVRALVAIRRRG